MTAMRKPRQNTEPCHAIPPQGVVRHESGVRAITLDEEEDAIVALGEKHLKGVRGLRSVLEKQEVLAEDLVFEVRRLRRRVTQLEEQLASGKDGVDLVRAELEARCAELQREHEAKMELQRLRARREEDEEGAAAGATLEAVPWPMPQAAP